QNGGVQMKVIALIFAALMIAGCTTQQQGQPSNPQQYTIEEPGKQPSQPGQQFTIQIENLRFLPDSITVTPGSEITWVNRDSTEHTVTFESISYDERIAAGSQAAIMFETAGTYEYICSLHPSMRGTVIVK
ncbi:MAG: cupredoxin domain-containing protein, partial [Candidatus Woesearchaeota archaeon]